MHALGIAGRFIRFFEGAADPFFGVGENVEDVFVGGFVVERCGGTVMMVVVMDLREGGEERGGGCQEEKVEG
jgi:hypothetical protein